MFKKTRELIYFWREMDTENLLRLLKEHKELKILKQPVICQCAIYTITLNKTP